MDKKKEEVKFLRTIDKYLKQFDLALGAMGITVILAELTSLFRYPFDRVFLGICLVLILLILAVMNRIYDALQIHLIAPPNSLKEPHSNWYSPKLKLRIRITIPVFIACFILSLISKIPFLIQSTVRVLTATLIPCLAFWNSNTYRIAYFYTKGEMKHVVK